MTRAHIHRHAQTNALEHRAAPVPVRAPSSRTPNNSSPMWRIPVQCITHTLTGPWAVQIHLHLTQPKSETKSLCNFLTY